MKSDWARHILLGVLLLVLSACNSGTNPTPGTIGLSGISGDYVLVEYAGQQLPADLGAIIPPGPGEDKPTDCRFLVTGGLLTIDMDAQTYVYSYELRESCEERLLSTNETYGNIEVINDHTLKFTIRAASPEGDERIALIDGNLVTVQEFSGEGHLDLVFKKLD